MFLSVRSIDAIAGRVGVGIGNLDVAAMIRV
jgi:hypothetical protein